jgi:hypothetical protein
MRYINFIIIYRQLWRSQAFSDARFLRNPEKCVPCARWSQAVALDASRTPNIKPV